MIGVEHHDHIGTHRREMLLLRREQLGGFAFGAVALDEEREYRGVRDAEPGDDICHFVELLWAFASTRRLCDINPGGAVPPDQYTA